jgi:DNA polymerase bacteriophage-type
LLSEGLRGAICAAPGSKLFVADYAAIEARVLLWLAKDEEGLDIFRRGEDIYLTMASDIYDRTITKADFKERQLGKATILGCGFQMGASKFVDTAAAYGVEIDETFSTDVVEAYRTRFWRVKQLWQDQQDASIRAVRTQKPVQCGRVMWERKGRFLYCQLPSGRRLAYPDPEIRKRMTPWGEQRPSLTYMGINSYTRQWQRQTAYGGMLVENMTQAVARDLMADAMLRIEQSGVYRPVLSVHDELIAEAERGSVRKFETLMAANPRWARGLPIVAEGWVGERYHK